MPARRLLLLAALAMFAGPARARTPSPPPPLAQLPSATMPVSLTVDPPPARWQTRAETSDYRITADYRETMRFCRRLEAASRWIRVTSYGKSGQGRDLPLVILSKDRAFTPELAQATGKPVVLRHPRGRDRGQGRLPRADARHGHPAPA
jgi:hypothetical protein